MQNSLTQFYELKSEVSTQRWNFLQFLLTSTWQFLITVTMMNSLYHSCTNRDAIFHDKVHQCRTSWIISQNLNFVDKNETFTFFQLSRKSKVVGGILSKHKIDFPSNPPPINFVLLSTSCCLDKILNSTFFLPPNIFFLLFPKSHSELQKKLIRVRFAFFPPDKPHVFLSFALPLLAWLSLKIWKLFSFCLAELSLDFVVFSTHSWNIK